MEENTKIETQNVATNTMCSLKMLVNNVVAGSIIGKNGSIITSIEQETGCSLKLSPANSYFPNTQERVLVLCGLQEQINSALLIILDKIRQLSTYNNIQENKNNTNTSPKYTCKIVVPKSSVSAIIGKGGQQIKQLQDSTGSKIKISNREDGLHERIITIVGSFEAISDTSIKVANSIQNDPNVKDLLNVTYNKEINFNTRNINPNFINQLHVNGYGIPQQYNMFQQQDQYMDVNMMNSIVRQGRDLFNLPCEISIQIPDEFIGSVIGKNGYRLTSIINSTGAQVRISRKGELIPGTTDRKVRIIGTVAAVHAAHVLLLQRLESVYMQIRSMQMKCDV